MDPAPAVSCRIEPDAQAAAALVADELDAVVAGCRAAGRGASLALPTGRTPLPVYAALRSRLAAGSLSLAGCRISPLDEYLGLGPDHPASFVGVLREQLLDHADLGDGALFLPDGRWPIDELAERCAAWERDLLGQGGLDLALLGLGRNGHVAFNEPGAPVDGRAGVVTLAEATRRDAAATFGGLEAVPTHGLTLGLGTLGAARRLIVLATGASKAPIVAQLAGPEGSALPAGQVLAASGGLLVLDRAAAAELPGGRWPGD